ncbi:Na+/H+ antiporter subunit A [Sporosarcina limicola]|uniref:Multicomponent Na+:H+ antiporter subunit A n=1 Tax=Sporosarcina limicola TaxID=34101 RepID=A0A927MP06_9BACL|nr:Na+/H+ antiporter subunit A [Sporosarcina limicola]MBE1556377.1 multicomponent Na+:H+ antiporter subunit A [Sporosarcina limicola]
MGFVLLIFLPIVAALFIPLLFKYLKGIHTGWFVLFVPIALFIYYAGFITTTMDGGHKVSELQWIPSLGISFVSYIDGLSLLFTLLITGIGALVVLYSIFYLDKDREKLNNFYIYLLIFMSAMLGVVQSDNVISLYLFWELTSISSFLLIGYWNTRDRSRFGALKSMMITVFGGLMMLGGFVLLGIMGDSFSIRELIANSSSFIGHEFFTLALILVLLGAFTKSAQFPFYIWLPDAMEAPTPVSAYLHSATMVKAGLYLVARFTPIFAVSEVWIWLVTGIGLLTLFWGSLFAVKQTDLKAILAFSTVSQLGLIMSLLGASAVAYHSDDAIFKFAAFAAIFHLINHATFKGSLFMIAGIIDHETGTRDIRKLGGLMSIMPVSFTVAFIGSMSMAGLPPFNGFLSKEMFFQSMLALRNFELFNFATWGILFPVIAWVASVFTFIYSFYFVFKTFTGRNKVDKLPKKPHEAPVGMLVAPVILATLVVGIFFIPNLVGKWLVKPAVMAIQPGLYSHPSEVDVHVAAWHDFASPELWMTIALVGLGVVLYLTMTKWRKLYDIQPHYLSLNVLYDSMMMLSENGMNRLSRFYMTGLIRTYLMYMFAFIASITTATLFLKNAFIVDMDSFTAVSVYGIMTAIILVAAVVMVILAKTRLAAIIALGAVGYSVSLFFVIFKAPDLALTQLVIETVSVALFLLAFQRLPALKTHGETKRNRLGNAIIAAAVGITVTLVALSAHSQKMIPSISQYYKDTVATEAGGGNIVNVILVDYRGFDTLFEIAVLAVAGIGVLAMIRLQLARKEAKDENK